MLGYSRKQMEARVEGIWEFTGLKPFADRPLKYYSSGMYMRLAFAIATEIHPDILLIDESLGAGDTAFVAKARERILGLLDRSNVVIIVSHDLGSLRTMCDRGIWLKSGRVMGDGPIDEMIDLYLADGKAPEPEPSPVLVDGELDESTDLNHENTLVPQD
jgi:ABC-type polysaccharide/polyol phosphate transport system ATPase subunit